MRLRTHRPQLRRGFSLLELLLAMSMILILSLVMYRAMTFTIGARRSAYAAVDSTRAGVIAADLVRQDLESIPPPSGILAREFVGIHTPGDSGADADMIEFSTIGRDAGADVSLIHDPFAEGLRRVEFSLRTDLQPPALVRRVTRNLLATQEPLVEEEILCRNVRSFSLRYFDGYMWQENWDSTTVDNILPTAVAITLEVIDPQAADPDAPGRAVTRIVPLACGRPLDALDALDMGGFE